MIAIVFIRFETARQTGSDSDFSLPTEPSMISVTDNDRPMQPHYILSMLMVSLSIQRRFMPGIHLR
jgi:hypothetical protein